MPAKTKAQSRKSPVKKKTTAKKSSSTQTRTPSKKAKSTNSTSSKKAGDQEVSIDRRRKASRRGTAASSKSQSPAVERRAKVQRRRQIDPTTCERDYSVEEVEFMNAMDKYKRTSGRMFPTCSEVLEVIRSLDYVKLTPAELATLRPETQDPVEEDAMATLDVSEKLIDAYTSIGEEGAEA